MAGTEIEPVSIAALTTAAKRKAADAIEHTHNEYIRKGGLKDLIDEAEKQGKRASTHIFALAQFAEKRLPKSQDAMAMFAGLTSYAETRYKEAHSVENLEDALPCWKVYKSTILRAWRLGLQTREYESLYDMRKSIMAAVRAGTEPAQLEGGAKRRAGPIGIDELQDYLGATGMHDEFRVTLAQIILGVERVKRGKVKAVEALFKETAQKLRELTGG